MSGRKSLKRKISASSALGPFKNGIKAKHQESASDGVDTEVPYGLEGEGNKCQRECWIPKGVDCEIPYQLGRRAKHSLSE